MGRSQGKCPERNYGPVTKLPVYLKKNSSELCKADKYQTRLQSQVLISEGLQQKVKLIVKICMLLPSPEQGGVVLQVVLRMNLGPKH